MLQNTFCHIAGISVQAEQRLWAKGLMAWEHITATDIVDAIAQSQQRLALKDVAYFAQRLPGNQLWRLFPEFRQGIVYLDIETTGLQAAQDHITSIALYDGQQIKTYVHGINLPQFVADIQNYAILVTYNGACFDIPFIQRYFGIVLSQVHIDLRYVLHSLGIKGGLKGCEIQLGLDRGDLTGVNGYLAILLWREYQRRQDHAALETLLAYNVQDVLSLEILLIHAYNRKLEATPFKASHCIAITPQPTNPHQPSLAILQKFLPSA
jgi:uncharacterized protein